MRGEGEGEGDDDEGDNADDAIRSGRLLAVELTARQRLSPTFTRLTFTGPALDTLADRGTGQWIAVMLPLPGRPFARPPSDVDWYAHWRARPDGHRPPLRTYTVRAVRPTVGEVDLDVARHAGAGARWAASAALGTPAGLVAPAAGHDTAAAFHPGDGVRTVLLAGDETAVPAIMSIVERLPAGTRGEAVLEVPSSADRLAGAAPPWFTLTWLGRDGRQVGSRLIPAVREAVDRLAPPGRHRTANPDTARDMEPDTHEIGADHDILWGVPVSGPGGLSVWLAGEAGMVRGLRHQLVVERGLDRRSAAFRAYWRQGSR